jgi:hypothetical protein
LFDGAHDEVQAALYLEHRARLAILKAAVDAVENGHFAPPEPGKLNISLKEITLPGSFQGGLDKLRKHKHFRLYPLFWQVFLWAFGGIILRDKAATEYGWLADQTGVPVEDTHRV